MNKDNWEEVGVTDFCHLKVPNLTEGQEYHFRVKAVNDIGNSEPLETDKPIKADRPPGGHFLVYDLVIKQKHFVWYHRVTLRTA